MHDALIAIAHSRRESYQPVACRTPTTDNRVKPEMPTSLEVVSKPPKSGDASKIVYGLEASTALFPAIISPRSLHALASLAFCNTDVQRLGRLDFLQVTHQRKLVFSPLH